MILSNDCRGRTSLPAGNGIFGGILSLGCPGQFERNGTIQDSGVTYGEFEQDSADGQPDT